MIDSTGPAKSVPPGMPRRAFLSVVGRAVAGGSVLLPALSGCSPAVTGENTAPQVPDLPLRDLAASRGLIYGASSGEVFFSYEADYAARFLEQCALYTPEESLKWTALRPDQNTFAFAVADAAIDFATTNALLARGHTLVWHESLPAWFASTVTAANAEQVLRDHIATVAGRYAGRLHSWDVVNEAIYDADHLPGGYRKSQWYDMLGPDYVDMAFLEAAQADPKALLAYSDYGLEYSDVNSQRKRALVLQLLSDLRGRGVPVHALCLHAHLKGTLTDFDGGQLRAFLRDVAALGVKIILSELDVSDLSLPADTIARDNAVATVYRTFLDAALDEPAVIAVVTWGLSDRHTWLTAAHPRPDGLPVRPLPFDSTLQPKAACAAMSYSLYGAPLRPS